MSENAKNIDQKGYKVMIRFTTFRKRLVGMPEMHFAYFQNVR